MSIRTKHGPPPVIFDAPGDERMRCLPELIAELGGDPDKVSRLAGVSSAVCRGEAHISFSQVIRLMEVAADNLNCPDFGMQLAQRKGPTGMFAQVGEMMKGVATFGDALRLLGSHAANRGSQVSLWLKRYAGRHWTVLGHAILSDGPLTRAQMMEELLLLSHLKMLELTAGKVRSRRILFRHQPVASPAAYRRHFGCEIAFGQNIDAIVYYDQDLAGRIAADCPVPPAVPSSPAVPSAGNPDPEVHAPLRSRVRIIVLHYLGSHYCTREQVAEALNLHPRTMDRRLGEEGTAFLDIKTEVRRDMLIYYLTKTRLDLVTVSQRLGYSEQAVMSRNCRKWFGKPPRQIRAETQRANPKAAADIKPGDAGVTQSPQADDLFQNVLKLSKNINSAQSSQA